ncbi:aminotransferase class IV [Oceanicaulis sp.]|uniref:aminotransferase class IV n=1 Tax=Oceanicaulis sp. TaxID=1924941 RepID=UPI003F72A9A4
MTKLWLNGAMLDADAARIDPADRGFLLGDGAFETLRYEAGAVRRWPRHRARLESALQHIEIACPDFDEVEAAAIELCQASALERAMVRLTVSRGASGGGLAPPLDAAPTVLITANALPDAQQALSARIVESARRDVRNISSRFKLTNYADMLAARRDAVRQGADMALVLSAEGHLSSADSANLFWVTEGRVFTPDLSCGCLPGTSRAALIAALKAEGEAVIEGRFAPDAVMQAEAAFLTNAVRGVMPLFRIEGRDFSPEGAVLHRMKALCDAAL